MRTLNRNQQPVYYATYTSKTGLKDSQGNLTGEYSLTYSKPVKAAWNIGVVESDAEVEMFGVHAIDTLTGVADKYRFPLDETSILWVGITPTIKPDGTTNTPHNYMVIGVRQSLNAVKFYARKVSAS